MKKGCKDRYDGSDLFMDMISPYKIEVMNLATNWVDEICVQCKINEQPFNFDNWKIG